MYFMIKGDGIGITRSLLVGMVSLIPPIYKRMKRRTGKSINDANYCYSVWLRHLTLAFKNGLILIPNVVAELGPGDLLGVGLAALLSGAQEYYALDVAKFSTYNQNIEIFGQLVELFRQRRNIPDNKEIPRCKPELDSYVFPHHILTEAVLAKSLNPDRLVKIEETLKNAGSQIGSEIQISSFAPWDKNIMKPHSVDFLLSQAVLEHVENLEHAYGTMCKWLKAEGIMSHTIDLKSHGVSNMWNGHWAISKPIWRIMQGKRYYFLNRAPFSRHRNYIKELPFEIICEITEENHSGIREKQLAKDFRYLSNKDLVTCGLFIQARALLTP